MPPALSFSRISSALVLRRSATCSSCQRASTWSFTSSSVRSCDGVIAATSYQTKPPSDLQRIVLDADSVAKAPDRISTPGGRPLTGLPSGVAAGAVDRRRWCGPRLSASAPPRPGCRRRRARPRSCRAGRALAPWRVLLREVALDLGRRPRSKGRTCSGSILMTCTMRRAEAALHRRADVAFLEREGGVGDRRVDHAGLGRRSRDRCPCSSSPRSGGERRRTSCLARACSAAARASSAFGNTICSTCRRSGVM